MNSIRDSRGRFIKGQHYNLDHEFKKGQTTKEPRPYWNKDILYNQYVINKLSSGDLARKYGVTECAILYHLNKFNIKRRSISETRQIKKWGVIGRLNAMYNIRGENHHSWKGGNTPERQKIYTKLEWKELRREVVKRDGYKCQDCRIPYRFKKLHVHHVKSFTKYPELRFDINNLRTVCVDCHKEYNKSGNGLWINPFD